MDNRLITFAVTAAICLASCSNDEVMEQNSDPKGKAITFYAKVGHSTRADETNISNLGNFYVFGKSVHPGGTLYNAYLVGEESDSENRFIPGTAIRTNSSWSLGYDVYLPEGIEDAVFWAFTDGQIGSAKILSNGSIAFNSNLGPQITGYTIPKADLTDDRQTVWADGSRQKDLVSAFGQARQTGGTLSNSIKLDFNHLLSQVTIKAAQENKAENDHRIVKVKGAWIVNVKNKADLSAGYSYDQTNHIGSDEPKWTILNSSIPFGTYFKSPVELWNYKGGDSDDGWADLTSTSLMLIPQTLSGLQFDNIESSETTGTYIMLLCRVELMHDGITHDDDTDISDIMVDKEGRKHYHQQFPVTKEDNGIQKYNANEYGLSCIPVKIDLKKGMHYTFKLDICGDNSGAGYYPPNYKAEDIEKLIPKSDLYDENTNKNGIKVIKIPDNKKPGQPVLDGPIQFTVSVNKWEDENWTWTNGTWTNETDKTNTTGESSDNN